MANLENNNESENKKSVTDKIESSVKKGVDNVQKSVKEASELASDALKHPRETAQEFGKQAAHDVVSIKWWARLLLYLFWIGFALLALIMIVLNLNVTKRWAANEALQIVNRDFKAEMSTDAIDVNFFGNVSIKGLKIKDYKGYEFIRAREFDASSDWISLIAGAVSGKSNSLSFKSLKLKNADIRVITYKGDSISNFIRYINLFDNGKKRDPNKPPFELDSRIELSDSKISIVNENSPGEAGKWLQAENVSLVAPSLKVVGQNVYARLNNLSFVTERWGKKHKVETFSADLSLTKTALSLKDLTINTDHSLLQGNISFHLNQDTGWQDFADKVGWEMNLKQGSQLSGYDISYFVTQWDNEKPFDIHGEMKGPLNGFTLKNFVIGNRNVSIQTPKMQVDRLLKGNFSIGTEKLSADFTYNDLKAMFPKFISAKMKNFADDFGRLRYSGSVSVTPKQIFVQKGSLLTGIGSADISNFYLTDFSTDLPKYRGYAEVRNLNTSAITKNKQVGLISGKFNLKGQSFDVNRMVVETTSQIASIDILGKIIHNATLNGVLDHKKYRGLIALDDSQVKGNVNGLIDFSTRRISADIKSDIQYLNVSYFTGSKNSLTVSGSVKGKFAMTSLNDLMLDVSADHIVYRSGGQTVNIPNADLKAFVENGNRIIAVRAPDAVYGKIAGHYNLGDLSGMIRNSMDKILVGPAPGKLYKGQNFDMDFEVQQNLLSMFIPEIRIPSGAHISGSYDGNSNHLILNADAEKLIYITTNKEEVSEADKMLAKINPSYELKKEGTITHDSAMADNILLRINTANMGEQIFARVDRFQMGSNVFKEVVLTGKNQNNEKLYITANFLRGTLENEQNGQMKNYAINLNQSVDANGDYVFRFDPTQIKFNEVTWNIDTRPDLDHSITYRRKTGDFQIKNLRIYSDDSELLINNALFRSGKSFNIDAEVHHLQIAKVFEMQENGNTMDFQGVANGKIQIVMNERNLSPLVDLTIEDMKMGEKDMGNLVISAEKSDVPNVFNLEAKVVSAGILGDNNLYLSGTVDNNTASPTLNMKADLKDFDLAFTQQFVSTVFSNMRGKANGTLTIKGPVNDIDYTGNIALSGVGLKLNFTGVDYSFEDTVIPLSKGFAELNNIRLKDGRSNSGGSVSGFIQFETIASMGVNLIISADNLIVLNTTQKDSDLFWGRVYGQGDLYVSGPVTGLDISTPNMKALQNSVFTFNSSSTGNVDEFKMLRFLEKNKEGGITIQKKKRGGANMNIDFAVNVDKGTTVNVLVGDDVGDISVRGDSPEIRFRMFRNGNIELNGNYIVDNGTYVSKAILERTFQIAKGSSIKWDGDAMTPQLDIKANYSRMVTNAGEYLSTTSIPQLNVLLTVGITGTLNSPVVAFNVDAPDASTQLKETLATKMSNEDEKIIQFGSVLLMSSFNVSSSGGFDIDVGKASENIGYNMLFKQLGSVLNTISNEFQVDLNYLKGDQAANTGDRANASVRIAVSPRISIKTGLGVPISKTENTTNDYLSGEGTIEYDWSKNNDGSRLLRMYSKPSNIGLVASGNANANQTYGVGVVYSKSFNQLFRRKNRKDKNIRNDTVKASKDSLQKTEAK